MRIGGMWYVSGMAALALIAAPLCAQEEGAVTAPADEADGSRPLAGMDADGVAAFFTLVAASSKIDAYLAPIIEQMLEPGEPVPDWRESGIDILAELGAREGGLAANLLRDEDPEVPSVTDLSGKAAPDLAGFTRTQLRAPPPGNIDERVFVSFTPGVWLEAASQRKMRGRAMCYGGLLGLTLHSRRPVTEQTMDELLSTSIAVSMFDRLASREFCVVYERSGDGYRSRSFLPDGRSLPQLDADTTPLRIMPAADLSAYIRDTVPTAPAEQADSP
jgi:hypothetical protein